MTSAQSIMSAQAMSTTAASCCVQVDRLAAELSLRQQPAGGWKVLEATYEDPATHAGKLPSNIQDLAINQHGIHFVQYGRYEANANIKYHAPKWQVNFAHEAVRNVRLSETRPTDTNETTVLITVTFQGTSIPPRSFDGTNSKIAARLTSQDAQNKRACSFPLAKLTTDIANSQDHEYKITFLKPTACSWPDLCSLLLGKPPKISHLHGTAKKFLRDISLENWNTAYEAIATVPMLRRCQDQAGKVEWLLLSTISKKRTIDQVDVSETDLATAKKLCPRTEQMQGKEMTLPIQSKNETIAITSTIEEGEAEDSAESETGEEDCSIKSEAGDYYPDSDEEPIHHRGKFPVHPIPHNAANEPAIDDDPEDDLAYDFQKGCTIIENFGDCMIETRRIRRKVAEDSFTELKEVAARGGGRLGQVLPLQQKLQDIVEEEVSYDHGLATWAFRVARGLY